MAADATTTARRAQIERLWTDFGPEIAQLALNRTRNPADADDLIQELFIFLCLFEGEVPDDQSPARVLAWIKACLIRISSNAWRAERRRRRREAANAGTRQEPDSPLTQAIVSERREAVSGAVESLDPADANLVSGLIMHGQTYSETATSSDQSISGVRRQERSVLGRLSRPLRRFKPIAWLLSALGMPNGK